MAMTATYDEWITNLPDDVSVDIGVWLSERLTEKWEDYDVALALIQEFGITTTAES